MSPLKALQDEIKKLVFYSEKDLDHSFLWKNGVPARLDVYRNNARLNWTDAMDHDFPLTRAQFSDDDWQALKRQYFTKHPPAHWELNTALTPFVRFLEKQKIPAYVKQLADYEWFDLQIFISRQTVQPGTGFTNPTLVARVFQFQIFDWVEAGAPQAKPPLQKPEVLVFYRDSKNTCHIQEADPLMLLLIDHFRQENARLDDLEPVRQKLLPQNHVPLEQVLAILRTDDVIL